MLRPNVIMAPSLAQSSCSFENHKYDIQILCWNVFCPANLIVPLTPTLGSLIFEGVPFPFISQGSREKTNGISHGEGRVCRLPGIHSLPLKGLKKERHLAPPPPPPCSRMEMQKWHLAKILKLWNPLDKLCLLVP